MNFPAHLEKVFSNKNSYDLYIDYMIFILTHCLTCYLHVNSSVKLHITITTKKKQGNLMNICKYSKNVSHINCENIRSINHRKISNFVLIKCQTLNILKERNKNSV